MVEFEILVKNPIFGERSNFWSKIEIWVKDRIFGQRSKFWSKIKILDKDRIFSQRSKSWSKIEFFFKNWNFYQRSIFWSKIEKSKCWPKIQIFSKLFLTLREGRNRFDDIDDSPAGVASLQISTFYEKSAKFGKSRNGTRQSNNALPLSTPKS